MDREERPDVDDMYMQAVQTMTGQGGWPLSVFLTPDRRPFYGGTYFPPAPRWGRPGFPQILAAIAGAWRERREELETSAAEMLAHLEAGRGERARAAAPRSDRDRARRPDPRAAIRSRRTEASAERRSFLLRCASSSSCAAGSAPAIRRPAS